MSKYESIPDIFKAVLEFNEWILWSINIEKKEFEVDYYEQYKNLRFWCVDFMIAKDLTHRDIPMINKESQNKAFKRARKNLDLKEFRRIKTHRFNLDIISDRITPICKT